MLSKIKHKIEPFSQYATGNVLVDWVSYVTGLTARQESLYFYLAKTFR